MHPKERIQEDLKAAMKAGDAFKRDALRLLSSAVKQAEIDTRNGVVSGHVIRVDPAVEQGTVTVDVAIDGELPKGARPDLSVDGTIELEKLTDVLYVGRPAFGQGQQTVGLFRLSPDGHEAVRVQVKLGRSSVSTIEVIDGLKEGDQVILSDTSAMDNYSRITVR